MSEDLISRLRETFPLTDTPVNPAGPEAADAIDALERQLLREMREALRGFLACPEIADCAPEDKDPETDALERRARAALASQPSRDYTHEVVPGLAQSIGERIAVQLAAAVQRAEAAEAALADLRGYTDRCEVDGEAAKRRAEAAEAKLAAEQHALEVIKSLFQGALTQQEESQRQLREMREALEKIKKYGFPWSRDIAIAALASQPSRDYTHEVVPGLAQSIGERIAVQLAAAVQRAEAAEHRLKLEIAEGWRGRAEAAEAALAEAENAKYEAIAQSIDREAQLQRQLREMGEALQFYAFSELNDDGKRARAALASQPDTKSDRSRSGQ